VVIVELTWKVLPAKPTHQRSTLALTPTLTLTLTLLTILSLTLKPGPYSNPNTVNRSMVRGVANLAILSLDVEIFEGFLATKFVPSS